MKNKIEIFIIGLVTVVLSAELIIRVIQLYEYFK